ncbi:hypothetical protein [Veronia pacifica]|uniref:Uncharacterized protein n=1 Tax=Veronia pacifica TaxID=1080227 RepID=A0A1C3ECN5_9GAMM|nr:hypothetical protein [Veronia pacifica]ODA30999.1 hypothetical protein A8L45_18355 [Veronia pacifica]
MATLSKDTLDLQNDIDRMLSQSIAVLDSLSFEDQFKCLPTNTIASVLWLLSDRLREIEINYQALTDASRHQ